jgi:hypothetical protein
MLLSIKVCPAILILLGITVGSLYANAPAQNNEVHSDTTQSFEPSQPKEDTLELTWLSQSDSLEQYKIILMDGSILIGQILERRAMDILVKTANLGTLSIPYQNIREMKAAETQVSAPPVQELYGPYPEPTEPEIYQRNYFNTPNSNSTRYFVGPSAINLRKGEAYYQNTYLFLHSVNVGITDNISVGGGIEFLSTFVFRQPLLFLTPKVGFQVKPSLYVGGGVLYASLPNFGSSKRNHAGVGYGLITYGNTNHNITLASGYGYLNRDFADRPIVSLSGMVRLSNKVGLITENWFVPQRDIEHRPFYNNEGFYTHTQIFDHGYRYRTVFSYGIRIQGGENVSVDLGLINTAQTFEYYIIGIPYINLVVKF